MSKPKREIVIPFDSAEYLERAPISYGSDPLILDDGTEIDLNSVSPFDPDGTPATPPAVRGDRDLLEALWLMEAPVWESEAHPRWPKGSGDRGGKFMRIGELFRSGGHVWQIAHIVQGRIYAHRAGGKVADTKSFEVEHHSEHGPHVPGAEYIAPTRVPKGGKATEAATVTTVNPYVDHASHDPSIPIPANSALTPDEWQRFGRLDQEHYTELQERFGTHKAGAAKKHLDASYAKFTGAAQQAVKKAYSDQYGSSSGFTLSLSSGYPGHGLQSTPEMAKLREECLALQAEHMAAVQWDLYNRTHSPDLLAVHKDSDHGPDWWQKEFVDGNKPVMSGLSQSFAYRRTFFGSHAMATPLAIRHVLMSTASAQPVPGSQHFPSELEVSVPHQWQADHRSFTFTAGHGPKQLTASQISWLEGVTSEPVGGHLLEQFKDALANGTYLPPPPKPAHIVMDGASGKTWVDPPDEAAKPEFAAHAPTVQQGKIPPEELPKDLPWSHTDANGVPEAKTGKDAGAHAGQYFLGLQGTLYWLGPDPGVGGGYQFRIHKIVDGQFNGENFAYKADQPGYYLDAKFDISKYLEKQGQAPEFHPEQWAKSTDTKFLDQFAPGEKFKIDGTAYEVTGKGINGQLKIKDLEAGLTGQINGDYKSTYLVPYGSEGSVSEPGLGPATYAAGEHVQTPFGKAQVTGVEDHELPGGGKGQLVTVQHAAGGKPATFGGNELAHWKPLTGPAPGVTFEEEGKKATVTKVLKNGMIQANLKPGKLQIAPEDFAAEHAHHAVPANLTIDSQKTKLGKMQVGDLFQHGTGNQAIRAYQVVHSDEGSKSVHVMNMDTGAVTEISKNTGFRLLLPEAGEEVPSPDEPKGAPTAVTGGGEAKVGLPWDQSKFEPGPSLTIKNMAPGTYFSGKDAGALFQKVGDTPEMSKVKNVVTGVELSIEHGDPTFQTPLGTWQPKGVTEDLPQWPGGKLEDQPHTVGEKLPLGEIRVGTFLQGSAGSYGHAVFQKTGDEELTLIQSPGPGGEPGKVYPNVPTDVSWAPISLHEPAADTSEITLEQPTAFDPSSYIEGEKVKLGSLTPGSIFKTETKQGVVKHYQLSADGQTTTNLVTGKTFPAKQHYKVTPLQPIDKPQPEAAAEPGAPGTVGALSVGDQFTVPTGYHDEGKTMEVTSSEPEHQPAVGHLAAYTTIKAKPVGGGPEQSIATSLPVDHAPEPNTTFGDLPKGALYHAHGATWEKQGEASAQIIDKGTNLAPVGTVSTDVAPGKPAHAGSDYPVAGLQEWPKGTIVKTEAGTVGKVIAHVKTNSGDHHVELESLGGPEGSGSPPAGEKLSVATEMVTSADHAPIDLPLGGTVTPLTDKATHETPYEQLTQGDTTKLGNLKPGDQFTADGADTVFAVMVPPDGYFNATVAPVYANGEVGQPMASGYYSDKAVQLHIKGEDYVPSPEIPKVDAEHLPDAQISGGLVPFEVPKAGKYTYPQIGSMPQGLLFQDWVGHNWVVKQSGSEPIISNGEQNYKVDPSHRGVDVSQLGVKVSFTDQSPPIGGESPPAELQAAQAEMVPNLAAKTLGEMQVKQGDYFQHGGSTWKVASSKSVVYATNVQTGKESAFGMSTIPGQLSPSVHVSPPPEVAPSEAPAPTLFTRAVKGSQLKQGDQYTLAPGSGKVHTLDASALAPNLPVYVQPEATAGFTHGVKAHVLKEGDQYTLAPGATDVYTKAAIGSTLDGHSVNTPGQFETVYVKPEGPQSAQPAAKAPVDPATAQPVHTAEDFAPPAPKPTVGVPAGDALEPFSSRKGPGGIYSHPKLHETQPGQLFTDKSGEDYRVVAHGSGKTVFEHVATGQQHETASTNRVKLTALAPNPGPQLAPLVHDLTAKYGSLESIPKMTLESAPTQATGTGNKTQNPRLGHLAYGQVAYDDAGHKVVFLGSWLNRALVLNASTNEARLADAGVRVTLTP